MNDAGSGGARSASVSVPAQVAESAHVGPRCHLGSGVTIGDCAVVVAPDEESTLAIRDGAYIGAGAVVAGAATVGTGAVIRPGAVVMHDVPPFAIVEGNPAAVVGYAQPSGPDRSTGRRTAVAPSAGSGQALLECGASLIRFPMIEDLRGRLVFAELDHLLPFRVERFFIVHEVPNQGVRGEHAHRTLHELLVCTSGRVRISLTDGTTREDVVLDSPEVGLYIPPFIWSTQFQHSPGAALVVLCSEKYDPASYIRDFDEFLLLRGK